MTSITLTYDITGSIAKCRNDSLGLKLVYTWIFTDLLLYSNVFINIHEYAK